MLAVLALAGGGALAQEATPGGKAVLARQAHYRELQKTLGGMVGELRKDAPDKAVVAANAAAAKGLIQQLPTWFPKGSGPEAGVKTAAKAEIWSDAAGFSAAAANLQLQASKLNQAAVAGDMAAVKAQLRPTGGACKACHDKYRSEMHH